MSLVAQLIHLTKLERKIKRVACVRDHRVPASCGGLVIICVFAATPNTLFGLSGVLGDTLGWVAE